MNPSIPPPLPGQPGSYCQGCQSFAPTRQVMFFQHIGAVILMFNRHIRGRMCRSCINEHFTRTTLITSFLGWWGMISFFLTPLFLLNNVVRYLVCLPLKPNDGAPANGTGLALLALLALVCALAALSLLAFLIYSAINH